jgi:hypothetical protein
VNITYAVSSLVDGHEYCETAQRDSQQI